MKPWINEEIFKSWTQAQKRLWNSLCSAMPFQPPAGVEAWRETYLKNLNTWEVAVKKTLSQEATWVRRWVEQVAQEKGTPELMSAWVLQMEEVLQRWVETQNQWWDEYFMVLRRSGGFTNPELTGLEGTPVTKATPPVSEPTVLPEAPFAVVAEPAPAANEAVAEPTSAAPAADPPIAVTMLSMVGSDPTQPDDLKLIVGIGPALERKLHGYGILSFRQLATLDGEAIGRLDSTIKAAGRIQRDDWTGQAKVLHLQKYQEQL